MEIGDLEIEKNTCAKFLGAHFDNMLTFDYHLIMIFISVIILK